jgi:hypothetical protein
LYALGVIPGIVGVGVGFALYVMSPQPAVIMPAYLLLELGAIALLRADRNQDIRT